MARLRGTLCWTDRVSELRQRSLAFDYISFYLAPVGPVYLLIWLPCDVSLAHLPPALFGALLGSVIGFPIARKRRSQFGRRRRVANVALTIGVVVASYVLLYLYAGTPLWSLAILAILIILWSKIDQHTQPPNTEQRRGMEPLPRPLNATRRPVCRASASPR